MILPIIKDMGKCFLRTTAICACTLFLAYPLNAQDLSISPGDLRIEQRADEGFHLFIRYKPDISSVLLTESTRDPQFRAANYAYRTAEKNTVNGSEVRLINGYPIPPESRIYSLVSSTPERHRELGWAYHIYIPPVLHYGYEGGELEVGDGTYLNIRAFYYAYADYRGAFKDNPFILRVSQQPPSGQHPGTYMQETIDTFTEIAGGKVVYSTGPSDLTEHIGKILEKEKNRNVDLVLCIDATGSMKPYIDAVRQELVPMLREIIAEFASFRIGMVLYKDYRDDFLTKTFPFTKDFNAFLRNFNTFRVGGGGDIPEAVYEGLYDGATKFSWGAESKLMILVGDAPPHPRPRGKITKQMVEQEVTRRDINVHAIILPE